MSFISSIFLIGSLPWFILLVYITKNLKGSKRILTFFANSIFYVFGGAGAFVFLLTFTAVVWLCCQVLIKRKSRWLLGVSICMSLLPLCFVKYANFAIENVNLLFGSSFDRVSLAVPVGISIFTFEAISLLCDVYKDTVTSASFGNVYLFLSFFPTVTSGPIMRFPRFETEMKSKPELASNFEAVEWIVTGLAKKVIIADKIAVLANYYFDGVAIGNTYSALGLWIGSIAYTLQLYFDFSGYSDVAIGIARSIGIEVPENFNAPYQAASISDFWKRWHISLSNWFRDHVYIPLGGNRCTIPRHILNLSIVWVLTGIWHGADWTFMLWGIGHLLLLILEKYSPTMKQIGRHWYGHLYTLFFVDLLWVLFRADRITTAGRYIAGMFRIRNFFFIEDKAVSFLPCLLLAIILCFPWKKWVKLNENSAYVKIAKKIVVLVLFGMSISAVINAGYAPYIYGDF